MSSAVALWRHAALVVACLVVAGVGSSAAAGIDLTLEEAAQAISVGDDGLARQRLEAALELDPRQAGVMVALARLHVRRGDLEQAEQAARRALEVDPEHVDALAVVGDVARARGDFGTADALYDRALRLDPGNDDARAGRSRLRVADGDLDGAARIGRPAADRSLALRLAWADAEADAGDVDAAIRELDELLRNNPGWVPALLRRGDLRRRQGDMAAANQDLETAVALAPASAETRYRRGLLRRDLRDVARALDDFDRAISLDGGFAAAYVARGSLYQATGQQAAALREFERALSIEPDNADALTHKATSACASGRFSACETAAVAATARAPDDWRAQVATGHARLGLGDTAGAVEAYARALDRVPASETQWLLARLQTHLKPRIDDQGDVSWRFLAAQTPADVVRLMERSTAGH
ncbi:MAG: tetratricopeptide repeat protein [Pseudomonadota bacterium]